MSIRATLHRKLNLRNRIRSAVMIGLGILSASFGLKGFLLVNEFVDGGATGISLLTALLTGIPLPILILVVNAPFILLGYHIMGRQFAVKASLAIAGLSLFLSLVSFPTITNDNLLVAIFGGCFLGAGIGFAIRGGAVIDGTEILAIYLSRHLNATIGDVIMMINVVIFSVAAWLLGLDVAMYSMVTYLVASRTLDFIVEGIEEYTAVTIVSSKSEEIRKMIVDVLGRGVTSYRGKKGYGKRGESTDSDILYTVITRLELNKLNVEIEMIDPEAFIVMHSVKDVRGGIVKKRPLKH